MTCADKLRDCPNLTHTGYWKPDGDTVTWTHDPDDCPQCLAAAVIEAAEKRRQLDVEARTQSREQLQDWCVRSYAADRRLDVALAALSARLGGAS